MEGEPALSPRQAEGRILQAFRRSFVQVQGLLDKNRLLIDEINRNHESGIPDNLSRNACLIREVNDNIRKVSDLYADLSRRFSKFAGTPNSSQENDFTDRARRSDCRIKRYRPS